MRPKIQPSFERLRNAEWFAAVGVRDTEVADVLSSWEGAIASCSAPEWERLLLEAANQHKARLMERSPERLDDWYPFVREVRPIVQALVEEKTRTVVEKNHLPEVFVRMVNWDILGLCMEAEYADVFPPAFYASQAYWYVVGHFPCGWRGEFPKGRLVIY